MNSYAVNFPIFHYTLFFFFGLLYCGSNVRPYYDKFIKYIKSSVVFIIFISVIIEFHSFSKSINMKRSIFLFVHCLFSSLSSKWSSRSLYCFTHYNALCVCVCVFNLKKFKIKHESEILDHVFFIQIIIFVVLSKWFRMKKHNSILISLFAL